MTGHYGLRRIIHVIVAMLAVSAAVSACSSGSSDDGEYVDVNANANANGDGSTDFAMLLAEETETPIESGPVDTLVHSLRSRVVQGFFGNVFCDSNLLQLTAAHSVGITPLTGLEGAYDVSHNVVKVTTCDDYLVAELQHSMPYLVPRAAALLHDIGRSFRDTVKARGGKEYRVKVTSMLRSSYSVSRLKRLNGAATDSSCHLYGTTFDLSWTNFDCRDSSYIVSLEALKNILAEIVWNNRRQGRCYAIYEHKRGCFHVTVR